MFNTGAFGLTPFNVEFSILVYGIFELNHEMSVSVSAAAILKGGFTTEMDLGSFFSTVRERLAHFLLEQTTDVNFNGIRERVGQFNMEIRQGVDLRAAKNHVETITFSGEFGPADQIVIDSKMLTFLKNNLNALESMEGDFFTLNTGDNVITYRDQLTGRDILIRITHRDKFV